MGYYLGTYESIPYLLCGENIELILNSQLKMFCHMCMDSTEQGIQV